MKTSRVFLLTAVVSLGLAGTAQAATVPVTSLSGAFDGTNSSVTLTADGVQYGPYGDGGGAGGSLYYAGFNGRTLGEISDLAYTIEYNTSNDLTIGAPYLRVFLMDAANAEHDVIYSPSTQAAAASTAENVLVTHDVTAGGVRYDDDPGAGPDQAWTTVKAAHAVEVVTGIYVTTGFSGGANLSALQTGLTVNGNDFCFGCPGSTGTAGTVVGAAPAQAQAGANSRSTGAAAVTCRGDALRRVRAPRRRGERFVSVRATLRGKRLAKSGRTVNVDLRGRAEGAYNVRLSGRYRTGSGKLRIVRSVRTLSVACS